MSFAIIPQLVKIIGRSLLFPSAVFLLLAISHASHFLGLARYDFLLIGCVGVQLWMLLSRRETLSEAMVITFFHFLGLMMELYKVHKGSWSYPEHAWSMIYHVPLYSGFMYASIASFLCQLWHAMELRIEQWPRAPWGWIIAAAIYFNFFSLHYILDLRWPLVALVFVCFRRSRIHIHVPLEFSFPLIWIFFGFGVMIWLGENLATALGAWKYAYQHAAWQAVSIHKIGSWTLMTIVSIIIVVQLKFLKMGLVAQSSRSFIGPLFASETMHDIWTSENEQGNNTKSRKNRGTHMMV